MTISYIAQSNISRLRETEQNLPSELLNETVKLYLKFPIILFCLRCYWPQTKLYEYFMQYLTPTKRKDCESN